VPFLSLPPIRRKKKERKAAKIPAPPAGKEKIKGRKGERKRPHFARGPMEGGGEKTPPPLEDSRGGGEKEKKKGGAQFLYQKRSWLRMGRPKGGEREGIRHGCDRTETGVHPIRWVKKEKKKECCSRRLLPISTEKRKKDIGFIVCEKKNPLFQRAFPKKGNKQEKGEGVRSFTRWPRKSVSEPREKKKKSDLGSVVDLEKWHSWGGGKKRGKEEGRKFDSFIREKRVTPTSPTPNRGGKSKERERGKKKR